MAAKTTLYLGSRKLISSLAKSLAKLVKARAKPSESTASTMVTQTISSHKSSSLVNCRPLNVSDHCPSKKLVFVPIVVPCLALTEIAQFSSFCRSMARDTASCVSRSNRYC